MNHRNWKVFLCLTTLAVAGLVYLFYSKTAANVNARPGLRHLGGTQPAASNLPSWMENVSSGSAVVDTRGLAGSFEYKDLSMVSVLHDGNNRYYVPPIVVLNVAELAKAYKKRVPAPSSAETPLYRVSFPVRIHSKEIREAAAAYLGARDGKPVAPEQISLLPFGRMEVQGVLGDRIFPMYESLPAMGQAGSTPTTIQLNISGTEEDLLAFAERGRARVSCYFAGFEVRRSLLNGSLAAFSQQGFSNDLFGDAVWQNLEEYGKKGVGFGISIGPISAGVHGGSATSKQTRTCTVTRNQAKAVTRKFVHTLSIEDFAEPGGPSLDDMRSVLIERMMSVLLSRQHEITVELDKDGEVLKGGELLQDLAPDRIATLNSHIKEKWDHRRKQGIGNGQVKIDDETQVVSDDDITWEGSGEAVVPKSVKLIQLSRSHFDEFSRLSYTRTTSTSVDGVATTEVLFSEDKPVSLVPKEMKVGNFVVPRMAHHSGGDPDIHSKNNSPTLMSADCSVSVSNESVSVIVTSSVTETRGNHTVLLGNVELKAPKPADFVELDADRINLKNSGRRIQAEQHDFVAIASPVGSPFRNLQICPDGPGDDHRGNAKARGEIVIPYLALPEGQGSKTKTDYSTRAEFGQ